MNIALIFAGGKGTRMNITDRPKQFLEINQKSILCYTIEHFENNKNIDKIIVVTVADWLKYTKKLILNSGFKKVERVISGGDSALNSQYLGIKCAAEISDHENTIVLVHDGVRPFINSKLIDDCIETVKKYGNAITTAQAIETIAKVDENNQITEIVERSNCQLARAPQAFYLNELLDLHERSINEETHNFIDSASMMMYYGKKLHTVVGPSDNIKVTTAKDYYMCKTLLTEKS